MILEYNGQNTTRLTPCSRFAERSRVTLPNDKPIPSLSASDIKRFWSKVKRGADHECWPWSGSISSGGYGVFSIGASRQVKAHRVAFTLRVGVIESGLTIDHVCRNRRCVNPLHLEMVTGRENSMRGIGVGALNRRKTHCPYGHPYDDVSYTGIGRVCRTCRRAFNRQQYYRNRLIDSIADSIRAGLERE